VKSNNSKIGDNEVIVERYRELVLKVLEAMADDKNEKLVW
jgi:hypothetical protein